MCTPLTCTSAAPKRSLTLALRFWNDLQVRVSFKEEVLTVAVASTDSAALHAVQPDIRSMFASTLGGTEASALTDAETEAEARVDVLIQQFLRGASSWTDAANDVLDYDCRSSDIPDGTMDVSSYLVDVAERIVRNSTPVAHPRFIGHMTSSLPYFVRPFARLTAALNQNMVKCETSRALSAYERQVLAMLHRLVFARSSEFYATHVQNAGSTLGVITSGGTIANVTALWCARNAAFGRGGNVLDVEQIGMSEALAEQGYVGAAIVGSALMHYSFEKAAGLLGVGTRHLHRVPIDGSGRVSVAALQRALEDCRAARRLVIAIVGVAGSTDCGSVDDLTALASVAEDEGVHFHVDAAWAGPTLFSSFNRGLLRGIERADSVTIDGHKQFYVPMGIGMTLFRDPFAARTIEKHAHYILRAGSSDLGRRSLEGSRPAAVLTLHAALHVLGSRGYAALIDEGVRKARYFASLVSAAPDFELLLKPETNIVIYRYVPPSYRAETDIGNSSLERSQFIGDLNKRLQEAQCSLGCSFVSRTTLDIPRLGRTESIVALRAVLANPLTTEEDLAAILEEQRGIAAGLLVSAPLARGDTGDELEEHRSGGSYAAS